MRLSYFEREGSDLARIEAADLLESFYRLQEDPERAAVLACLAEIADAFAREQQEDEAYFRLLRAVLAAIRDGLDLERAARYFEVWTLRLHGVLPPLNSCARCEGGLSGRGGIYDRREGVVLCRRCAARGSPGSVPLTAAALAEAALILKEPPGDLAGRAAAGGPDALAPLAALAEALFFDLTERRFKSYEVLRSLRGGP